MALSIMLLSNSWLALGVFIYESHHIKCYKYVFILVSLTNSNFSGHVPLTGPTRPKHLLTYRKKTV